MHDQPQGNVMTSALPAPKTLPLAQVDRWGDIWVWVPWERRWHCITTMSCSKDDAELKREGRPVRALALTAELAVSPARVVDHFGNVFFRGPDGLWRDAAGRFLGARTWSQLRGDTDEDLCRVDDEPLTEEPE